MGQGALGAPKFLENSKIQAESVEIQAKLYEKAKTLRQKLVPLPSTNPNGPICL